VVVGSAQVGEGLAGTKQCEIIVRMASIGVDGPTGGYVDDRGTVPW
jgi:hypothetical protein